MENHSPNAQTDEHKANAKEDETALEARFHLRTPQSPRMPEEEA
jgi:hypothetical protein